MAVYSVTDPNVRTQILRQAIECSLDGKIWFRSMGIDSSDHECRTIVSCQKSGQPGFNPQQTRIDGADIRGTYQENSLHDPLTT